jgi:hypothetical protein
MHKWARFFAILVVVILILGPLYVSKGDRVKIRLLGVKAPAKVDETLGGRLRDVDFREFRLKLERGESILPRSPKSLPPESPKSFRRSNTRSVLT